MSTNKPSLVPSAMAGGLLLGILSGVPLVNCLNCACCITIILGGILSSYLYLRNYPATLPPVTYGDGAVLGLLTGVFGTVFWAFIHILFQLLKQMMGFTAAGMGFLREIAANPDIPPEVREILQEVIQEYVTSSPFSPFSLVISITFMGILSLVFATIGSIIGVALFQKQQPGSGIG